MRQRIVWVSLLAILFTTTLLLPVSRAAASGSSFCGLTIDQLAVPDFLSLARRIGDSMKGPRTPNGVSNPQILVPFAYLTSCVPTWQGRVPWWNDKTYYHFAGHSAVRYGKLDIPIDLRNYIQFLGYDLPVGKGSGYGARLKLTVAGCIGVASDGTFLYQVANFVERNPEWQSASSGRTFGSLVTEIQSHCVNPFQEMNLEYYYDDFRQWEKDVFGR